jgi:hypothetical protein
MKTVKEKGWKHPGRMAYDYGHSDIHDHDHRTYPTRNDFTGKGPLHSRRDPSRLYEEVCEQLYLSPDVDATEIKVSIDDRTVILEGFVDSRFSKKCTERTIEKISGVSDVINKLRIKDLIDFKEDKIIARNDDGIYSQEIIPR